MRKTFLLIAAFITLAANVQAKPVDTPTAQRVAATFWNRHRPADAKPAGTLTKLTFTGLDQLHIFDINGTGFVIVAADDRIEPILAYSFANTFPSELNPEVGYWLNGYNSQIASVAESDYMADQAVAGQWAVLLNTKDVPDSPKDLTGVPAMLTTQWNQSSPYNHFCPYDTTYNDRAVVGCVATAMAQIMKYWNYPSFGQGSKSYIPYSWSGGSQFGTLTADFEHTTYLWQFMKNTVDQRSLTHVRDAVATISYHCGVAVEMMYGVSAQGGSGAYTDCGGWVTACATNAFHEYFKYDTSLFYLDRDGQSDSAWRALIDEQMFLRQPIYYHGSDSTGGHAFVLDGSDTAGRYHFNWGWGGYGDGFYALNDLAPRSGGAGGNATYTFNSNQGAIFGIKPGVVETFDTVDFADSTCTGTQYVDFREYHMRVSDISGRDTLLRHLDTIFRYHLHIINKKNIFLHPNFQGKDPTVVQYCPANGFTFPECSFEKAGSMFAGWCFSNTGDDTIYQPGQTIAINVSRTCFALWIDTTGDAGINEFSILNSQFSIYPNPTTGEIYLSIPLETGTIIVTDVLGRAVLRDDYPNIMGGNAKISLSELPDGIYNIQVKTDIGIYNQRIIKR